MEYVGSTGYTIHLHLLGVQSAGRLKPAQNGMMKMTLKEWYLMFFGKDEEMVKKVLSWIEEDD